MLTATELELIKKGRDKDAHSTPAEVFEDDVQNTNNVNFSKLTSSALKFKTVAQFTPILTPRQLECVKYISQGYSIKETAFFLGISSRTVETHINHVKSMMSAKNIVELIAILIKLNII